MNPVCDAEFKVSHYGIWLGKVHNDLSVGVDKLLQIITAVNFRYQIEVIFRVDTFNDCLAYASMRAQYANLDSHGVFSFFSHIGSTFLPILTRMGVAQFLACLGMDLRSSTMP